MSDLIIVNGDEEFLKERSALQEATALLSSFVVRYRFGDELDQYLEESQLVPIFGNTRVFILFDAQSIPDLPAGDKDTLICVSCSGSKKKLSDSRAKRVYNFPKLKSFSDNNEIIKWAIDEGDRLNIDLSRVAGALFVNSGGSLRKIHSEIRKLAVITPSGGIVSPENAKSVMCFSAELTPRSVIDSICEGHPAKAITVYDKLQEGSDETGWIIAYLQRHVIQQLRLEAAVASGMDSDSIAQVLGIHPFVYRKTVQYRIGLWSVSSLSKSVEQLGNLDISHKSGRGQARTGLETEIVRLSEEAKENVEQRIRGRN